MRMVEKVHHAMMETLRHGDIAIDGTAGNGHDVEVLAGLVGNSGKVHAFDLQESAIKATKQKLKDSDLLDRCVLHQAGHEKMGALLPPASRGQVRFIVFNLGYLPGGDKSIVTTPANTLAALEISADWLQPDGLLAVTAYRGHPGGMEETSQVEQFVGNLAAENFDSFKEETTAEKSPVTFFVRKAQQTAR
ncbi:MAG: hypothetical protein CMI31_14220 [Opitutae bacterium]|nr:hypothetical protein [Opitutae bacterium]MBG31133.1 hypothetical protein [Opitutae bacterium]|tara:strand:+ start:2261 stop:2833 length:573 start_codon:yes stop_codon:yes gene_type:complete